jgi:DNA polymerase
MGVRKTTATPKPPTAAPFVPASRSLRTLRRAADHCQGCDLYLRATQTVFGEGPAGAELMLVGEIPGDREDIEGHVFVGPAGRLLDEVLEAAGAERAEVYITNAVKHFKWEPRGKRRLHKSPAVREMNACRPWLEAEIDAVGPRVIVALGATAAQSLLGRDFRLTKQRGRPVESAWGLPVVATYHPAAVLRAPDHDRRAEMKQEFIGDIKAALRVRKK